MGLRYEEADDSLVEVFIDVLGKRFPYYQNLSFKLLYDNKKKVSKGNIVLASTELTSDKIKFFSKDNVQVEGYDYIVTVDKKAWEVAADADKIRLISHELSHVFVDEKGKCKLLGHELEDFYKEIEYNRDDPKWGIKLAQLVDDMYSQEKEMAEEAKKPKA